MTKRTIAIKFDREKFRVFDGMKIYDVNIFERKDNIADGIYFCEFTDMERMNQIIEEMIKAPSGCEDFDEWQKKLP